MHLKIVEGLLVLFVVLTLGVCGKKGVRSLVSLGVSAFVLVIGIVPLILKGYNPTMVVMLAAIPMCLAIVYLTEGWNRMSHGICLLVFGNFFVVSALAWAVVRFGHLSGLVSEEEVYVAGYGTHSINLPALLVAGILLGILGVLIEMVVTQVTTVKGIMASGEVLAKKQLFWRAHSIGVAHLGSLINTLFLIYAAASLPIIIILTSRGTSVSDLLHNELVITEVIRILISTLSVLIAMPSSTAVAVWWLR